MTKPGQQELIDAFSSKPWFHSVGEDQYGRHVVYVKYMCDETLHNIPDKSAGKQVLVHFAGYLEATINQFANVVTPRVAPPVVQETEEEREAAFMEMEIFALKRICGEDNLTDILYEIHEDMTASENKLLTDVSSEFPEARARLEKLYEKYGCDVLFEEIE